MVATVTTSASASLPHRTIVPREIQRNHVRNPASLTVDNLKSNQPYGDSLDALLALDCEGKDLAELSPDNWREQVLRIYFQNINGVRMENDGVDIGDLFHHMDEINADVFGFVETKVNSQLPHVRTKFHQYSRKIWSQSKLHFGHSDVPFEGTDKPGGLLMGLTRRLVGRCRAPFADPFGRWCSLSLLGRDNRLVTIIVAYQVVQASGDHGEHTLYEQQRALYRAAGIDNPNPRRLFIHDLAQYVSELHQAEHDIILMGDFNEEVGLDAHGMQVVLDAGGLTDCHVYRHGLETEQPTYARGCKRVDYMFVSSQLVPHLKHSGIEPFNHRIFSDHRGMFIDLRLPGIFDRAPVAIAAPSERHVRTDVPPLIIKYITALNEYCTLHDVYRRASEMLESEEPCHELAESVKRDILRGMLHAELNCKSYKRLPWSEDVHTAMTTLHILKRRLSSILTGYDMTEQIERRQRSLAEPVAIPATYSETVQAIRHARRRCREVAKKARELREEYHQLRIRALQAQFPDKDPTKLENQYHRAQEMKNLYQRIPSAKPRASGGLSMLKVPCDPGVDPKDVPRNDDSQWRMIQDPQEIERTLLDRNIKHFGQAQDTPLAVGIKYRELLHYAEDNGLLNPGCYSSRPHRQALDPVFLEILQYDYVLATRYPHLKFSNDATACYDRMLAHITVLITRAFGLEASVAAVQGNFLEYAKYLVKTLLGVSTEHYQHSDASPIFGNGQGSTSSPPAWGLECSMLFDIYEEQCHGAEYFSPDRAKRLHLGMAGFVDDNNSQIAGTQDTTVDELVHKASHDAQLWRDLIC